MAEVSSGRSPQVVKNPSTTKLPNSAASLYQTRASLHCKVLFVFVFVFVFEFVVKKPLSLKLPDFSHSHFFPMHYRLRCPIGFLNVQKSPRVNGCFSLTEFPNLKLLHFLWRLWPRFCTIFSLPSWLRSVHFVPFKYKMRGKSIWNIWMRIKWKGNLSQILWRG